VAGLLIITFELGCGLGIGQWDINRNDTSRDVKYAHVIS
jgi:hypothetical protein